MSTAWVTLATNDGYAIGALVLAHSLRNAGTEHKLHIMYTNGVSPPIREQLKSVFDDSTEVDVLDSHDTENLALIERPDLGVTFTKLHCWRLTQYEKCVFLDADTFFIQNADELFERPEFSAAPDIGWPDLFNTGVFVYVPSIETYRNLLQFALSFGSFDGGDQGLLNLFFPNWASGDSSKRLPFTYNTCSTACYSYLPAFKQFGGDVKILHFIGQLKPWLISFDPCSKKANPPHEFAHLADYLGHWWNVFCSDVHSQLKPEMAGLAGALAQLTLGAPRTEDQQKYEDSCRRFCWEHGNIDYLGKDSFDNIWKKIQQTLDSVNEPPKRERSLTPQPEDKLPKDAKKEGN